MGWFERVRKANAGQRVTRSGKQDAVAVFAEFEALEAERARLLRVGMAGTATIVGIRENVATTTLGTWHELALDVRLPDRDEYRATRRVALELSTAPQIATGAEVPVRVDPADPSTVLVVITL